MSSLIETDVLIVGAGPAGSCAALFLAKKGIPSVVIDKEKFPRDKICGDAFSGKVTEVLNKLDKDFINEFADGEKMLDSWGIIFTAPSGQSLRVPFKSRQENERSPGFISRRIDFDNYLIEKVRVNKNITLLEGTEIRNYAANDTRISAVSKDGKDFKAKIVIACDGAYSTFAKDMGGMYTEPAHNSFGLRAYYKNVSGLDKENFIELHFLNEILPGYFWLFPLPGGYVNAGIGMRADKMSSKNVSLKKIFNKIIETHPAIAPRFKEAEKMGEVKLHGLPLGSVKRNLSGNNYMLCGDAAQLIDPFSGEGIGNAMMSGMYAALQAEACLQQKKFSASFMKQYDKALYQRLWPELLLSYRMQQLANLPGMFNFVVRKISAKPELRESITQMYDDLALRARLKDPRFYFKLLFS